MDTAAKKFREVQIRLQDWAWVRFLPARDGEKRKGF